MKYMCGGKYEGTYVVDGILNLSEALKTSTVTSLRSPPPLTPPPQNARPGCEHAPILQIGVQRPRTPGWGRTRSVPQRQFDAHRTRVGYSAPEPFSYHSQTSIIRARSLVSNQLGPQGGAALAEGLKGNSTLTSLKSAARHSNSPASKRAFSCTIPGFPLFCSLPFPSLSLLMQSLQQ